MELHEKLLLFLCLIPGYDTLPKDMSGKAFIFPVESNTAYVKITPDVQKIFFAVTVCVRFFSDHNKELSPFSLATPTHSDGFVFFKGSGKYRVYVNDKGVTFWELPYRPNDWNSVCATWDASTGLTQLWVNGRPSVMKALQPGGSIAGVPSIVLGQDQDGYNGGFDVFDAFYGHLKDVHMWDTVLSRTDIRLYMEESPLMPHGNIVNWHRLEYTTHGFVVVHTE